MSSLTCPNCGRDNPDFLDDCQFCQTALRREATVSTGDNPTKKTTGELEQALPSWLQDARKQARDSAEEEAAKEAIKSRIPKEEPPDLLAGLAFQAESDEEEVPDWLSAIKPAKEEQADASSKPANEQVKPSDFFAQFEGSAAENIDISPTIPMPGEQGGAAQDEALPWMPGSPGGRAGEADSSGAGQKDELTAWFSQTTADSGGSFTFEPPDSGMDRFKAPGSTQGPSEEPEDLSWLRDLEASSKGQPPAPAPGAEPEDTGWMSNLGSPIGSPTGSPSDAPDDLSWLNNFGGTPGTPVPTSATESQPEDLSWLTNLGGTPGTPLPDEPAAASSFGPAASKEEDLGWLKDLGSLPAASEPTPSPSVPSSTDEDLSWLDTLGGTTPASASQTSGPAGEDLGWLKDFGATSAPAAPAPGTLTSSGAAPAASDDLSWLKDFGTTPASSGAAPTAPAGEDLDWLKDLSGTPAGEPPASQPVPAADDLGWLNELGATPASSGAAPTSNVNEPAPAPFAQTDVPDWLTDMEDKQSLGPAQIAPFSPARTAPLSAEAAQQIPDWLRSATEAAKSTSLPPLEAIARDRSAEKRKLEEAQQPSEKVEPAPVDESVFSTPADTTLSQKALDNQDVDALFAVDMPDWLSQPESAAGEPSAAPAAAMPAGVADELSPVDLPSWVQAMRPVEAVMGEASAISPDQTTEREGPLAGLRGVIPFVPIGSAQRPKAISLKLQATAEQQAGAVLVEQIIAGESIAQPLKTSALISSQRALRWGLAALFLLVLGAVLALGSPFMPISSALPVEVTNISNAILALPAGANVLVVMDYEPSLAGEMEAASGPLLDQLVVLRKPVFTFVASSPNGAGLVDRLLANTKISKPASEGGQDYQAGTHYFNAGYLPAGMAGVRGFTEAPQTVLPDVRVNRFSEFAAVILITDRAEAGQVWIEQLTLAKQTKQVGLQSDPALVGQQVFVVASGQAGPMLRPYVSSQQVTGMVSGLPDAARYEYVNNTRPGIVRSYWDAFGAGLLLAIISIVLGSLWSLFARIRARRVEAEPG
jgi:hypothetical protein